MTAPAPSTRRPCAFRGRKIGLVLEQLSLDSFERDGTLISVLVVTADTGLPSTGSYALVGRLRGDVVVEGTEATTARRERNRLYDAHPLSDVRET